MYKAKLTVGLEKNFVKNAGRKEAEYEERSRTLNDECTEVNCLCLSSNSFESFLNVIMSIGI